MISNLTYSNNKGIYLSYEYIIQINCEDLSRNIVVVDNSENSILPGGANEVELSDMFGSKELKETILTNLYNSFTDSNMVTSKESLTDTNYAYIDGVYYISLARLQKMEFSGTYNFTSMTSNDKDFLYGLRYLPNLKSIYVTMDFNAGNGEDLVNLESISAKWSYVDFSNLTTSLSNLKTLSITSFNGFVINSDIGKFMPNLSSLTINGTDNSNRAYEYFDLNHLRYFIYDNKTFINYLYLNKVTYNNGSNPGFSNIQVGILIDLRNAYKTTISTNYVEPSYYIGTPTSNSFSNSAKLQFRLDDSGNVEYVYLDSNTKWSSSGAPASDNEINEFDQISGNVFDNNTYSDLGLMINETRWNILNESEKIVIARGSTLKLPILSGKILFGVSNDELGSNMKNNLSIEWYKWSRTWDGIITLKEKLSASDNSDYIEYACNDDEYLILAGLLNDDVFFIYQFVVGDGDGIYSLFDNNNLRLWAFINAEVSDNSTLSLGDSQDMKSDYSKPLLGKEYTWNSSYDRKIKISSIEDLNKVKIKDYLIGKIKNRIIKLELKNTKFKEFSFFENLVNIISLDISNSVFAINDLSMFTKLEEIDASSNYNINPNIILNFPSSISSVNLRATKCEYNLDTFLNLQKWFNNDSNLDKTITLSLYYTSQKLTKSDVDDFISNVSKYQDAVYDISSTDNTFHDLYATGSLSIGTAYSITWPNYKFFQAKIGDYAYISTNGTSVNVYWTQNGTIFSNIPVSFTFLGSTSDVKKFSSSINNNGLDIDDLNYELISYGVSKGAFKYSETENKFVLQNDVEIYTWDYELLKSITNNLDNFIKEYKDGYLNLYLVEGGKCFKLKLTDSYYNLYSDSNFVSSYTKNNDSTLDKKSNSDLLNKIKFKFDDLNYTYYNENDENKKIILKINMPGYIWIDGVAYKLYVSSKDDKYNDLVTNDNDSILLDSTTMSSTNFAEGTTTNVNFQLYIKDGSVKYLGNSDKFTSGNDALTITVYHGQSTDILIDSYDLYVEAEKDSNGYYIAYGSTEVNEDNEETNIIRFEETNIIKANKVSDTHYDLDSSGTTYLVRGSEIFDSGRFQYALIQKFVNNLLYESSSSSHIVGTVISTSKRVNMTELSISGYKGQSDAISSIEGIQIFYNLQKFDFTGGIFQSLEPLRSLKLIYFYYRTTDTNTYTMVEDFSPLLEGSADTLKEFQYASRSNTFVNDFSFLLNFNNLKTVYMFSTFINGCDNKAYKYMNLTNFAYLVDSLNNKGVEVVVKKSILGSNPYIEIDTVKHSSSDEYTVKVKTEYKEAIRLLGLYETSSVFDLSPKIVNNHMLNISKDSTILNKNYVYLPATLNDSGKLYLIDYTSASASLNNISYVLKTSTGEEVLTASEAEALIKTSDFYSNQLSKTSVLYVKIEVASNVIQTTLFKNCGYLKLNMRILVGTGETKYYTERTLTLNFI